MSAVRDFGRDGGLRQKRIRFIRLVGSSGGLVVRQAPRVDGLSFDPVAMFQNGFAAPDLDISRGEVLQAHAISKAVVVVDEGVGLLPEITGQVVGWMETAWYWPSKV